MRVQAEWKFKERNKMHNLFKTTLFQLFDNLESIVVNANGRQDGVKYEDGGVRYAIFQGYTFCLWRLLSVISNTRIQRIAIQANWIQSIWPSSETVQEKKEEIIPRFEWETDAAWQRRKLLWEDILRERLERKRENKMVMDTYVQETKKKYNEKHFDIFKSKGQLVIERKNV